MGRRRKKMAEKRFKVGTPWADMIAELEERLERQTLKGVADCRASLAYTKGIAEFGMTILDGFLELTKDEAEIKVRSEKEGWVIGVLEAYGTEMSLEVREILLNRVEHPMSAFMLYIKMADLTDEEDALLESKFKGLMPRAEQELADGIVNRKKNG